MDAFVAALHAELGEALEAVWLYGSRARGEDTGWGSDIDLMVITAPPIRRYGKRIQELIWDIAGPASFFSVQTEDTRGLAERRATGDFFHREIDRDRIVAASALLSEEDLHHRTHKGTWQLLLEHFVLTDRFPRALHTAGASTQYLRACPGDGEASDYKPPRRFEAEEAAKVVGQAREFLARAEAIVGV